MKIPRLERLARLQREYHRSNPWRLSQGGLYIPHSYSNMAADDLSYWDDVGFILNGRRIIVWWQHPRCVYADQIEEMAYKEVGEGPKGDRLFEGGTKNYKRVGRSRKKLVSYTSREPSSAQREHYDLLRQATARLSNEGINFGVAASWKWERLNWAMGVSLVAPMEVRNEVELASVAHLARRLILRQCELKDEFPAYRYGRDHWLEEQNAWEKQLAICGEFARWATCRCRDEFDSVSTNERA